MLDIAIAVDRVTAIQWPVAYKLRNRARYAALTLMVALCLAAFDVAFIWFTTEVQPNPGCPGGGCFMSDIYLNYSGYSDMSIDSVGLVITALLLISLILFKRRSGAAGNQDKTFKRANRTAVSVLLCSSITLLLPGALQGVGSTFGFSAIQKFGPSVAFGMVLNAAANPFIYGYGHTDIYRALRKLLNKNTIVEDIPRQIMSTTAQS
uniref:G-protein coupled receptors family 1 profile domain-containing protein n=1 Tax=Plectus sambesii TaxID=2011161 RepID=A0A914XGP9_9BILA